MTRHGHHPRRQRRLLKREVPGVRRRRRGQAAAARSRGRWTGSAVVPGCALRRRRAMRWRTAPIRSRALPDVPAALMLASTWLRDELQFEPARRRPPGRAWRSGLRPGRADRSWRDRAPGALHDARAAASTSQSGADPLAACPISRIASGRLLRHGLSPRPRRGRGPLRHTPPAARRRAFGVTGFTVSPMNMSRRPCQRSRPKSRAPG